MCFHILLSLWVLDNSAKNGSGKLKLGIYTNFTLKYVDNLQ